MSSIREVMTALTQVQESLSITDPSPVSVKKAWPYSPPQAQNATVALPCWTNSWSLLPVRRISQGRWRDYSIHMQLYVAQATKGDDSRAADIASAFEESLQTALSQRNAQGLGGVQLYGEIAGAVQATVTQHVLRGGAETLAVLDRAGVAYIGLDLFLDVQLRDTVIHS